MSWAEIIIALNSAFRGNNQKTIDELMKEKIDELGKD